MPPPAEPVQRGRGDALNGPSGYQWEGRRPPGGHPWFGRAAEAKRRANDSAVGGEGEGFAQNFMKTQGSDALEFRDLDFS